MKANRTLWTMASLLGIAAVLYLPASLLFPRMLFFPYQAMAGETPVYSSTPIPPQINEVVARADARVRESAIFTPKTLSRPVFLTDGGIRWRVLSLGAGGAFALTRPLGANVVVNRSSIASDRVWNGAAVAGHRDLAGVIAHERTHMLIRGHFGLAADSLYPGWVREGYCDHVAGSSSLSDGEAARLRTEGSRATALFYYDSRKRVERALRDNGGSVDALFSSAL